MPRLFCVAMMVKTKDRQFDDFVVTGGTVSCNDNLRCHQLRQSCQIDDLLFSVDGDFHGKDGFHLFISFIIFDYLWLFLHFRCSPGGCGVATTTAALHELGDGVLGQNFATLTEPGDKPQCSSGPHRQNRTGCVETIN